MKKLLTLFAVSVAIVGLSQAQESVLANTTVEGQDYRIVVQKDEDVAAMFLKQGEKTVAGDSFLFPLKDHGVSESVANGLARDYVNREIEMHGVRKVQDQIKNFKSMPADLHAAYSRHFNVKAKKIYGSAKTEDLQMTSALRNLANVKKEEGITYFEKHVEPVSLEIMKMLAKSPNQGLSSAMLKALAAHRDNAGLQRLALVYVARQPQHFVQSFTNLETSEQRAVKTGIESGLNAKLLGKSLSQQARELISTL